MRREDGEAPGVAGTRAVSLPWRSRAELPERSSRPAGPWRITRDRSRTRSRPARGSRRSDLPASMLRPGRSPVRDQRQSWALTSQATLRPGPRPRAVGPRRGQAIVSQMAIEAAAAIVKTAATPANPIPRRGPRPRRRTPSSLPSPRGSSGGRPVAPRPHRPPAARTANWISV